MRNLTHVSLILDKSGSMSSVREKTISGVNEYFQTLKNDKNSEYTVDLVLFDNSVHYLYRNQPLSEVQLLTEKDYQTDNNTGLYDAICETLLGHEAGSASKWIVVVMTDGEENTSKQYTEVQLAQFIKLLKCTGWVQFVFLGANQDSFAKATKWNIDRGNTSNFNATDKGVGASFTAMAMNTVSASGRNWQSSTSKNGGTFFDAKQQKDLENTQ